MGAVRAAGRGTIAPVLLALLLHGGNPAAAQTPPRPPLGPPPPLIAAPPPPQPAGRRGEGIRVRGFGTIGATAFAARESFEAVLGSRSGAVSGGGGQVLLPWGIFAQLAMSRFRSDGERVFVGPGDEVFRLGIPATVTITPVEFTVGWRYGARDTIVRPPLRIGARRPRVIPYGGGGYSSYGYRETSRFATASEDVSERFGGYHLTGGVEYLAHRWVAVGAELSWASIPDALGQGGVSAAFGEDNLGGTSVRLKIAVGR
jgi:hypothetical protein